MTHNGNNPYARSEIANIDEPPPMPKWDRWLWAVLVILSVAIAFGGYWLVVQPLKGMWE